MCKTPVLLDLFVNLIAVYHLAGKYYLVRFAVTITSTSHTFTKTGRFYPWRCLLFFRVPWRGSNQLKMMRTSADHASLEQPTKVNSLGITGSYHHVNCALSRKRKWTFWRRDLQCRYRNSSIPGVRFGWDETTNSLTCISWYASL